MVKEARSALPAAPALTPRSQPRPEAGCRRCRGTAIFLNGVSTGAPGCGGGGGSDAHLNADLSFSPAGNGQPGNPGQIGSTVGRIPG